MFLMTNLVTEKNFLCGKEEEKQSGKKIYTSKKIKKIRLTVKKAHTESVLQSYH